MKAISKYYYSAALSLMPILLLVQLSWEFSGWYLLPVVHYVFCALTLGMGIPLVAQFVLIFVVFGIIAASLLQLLPENLVISGLQHNILQPVQGGKSSYPSIPVLSNNKTMVKENPVVENQDLNYHMSELGILMISSGRIMFADKAFLNATGYLPDDIFGKDFASLIQPESLINYTMLSRMSANVIKNSEGIHLVTKNHRNIAAFYFVVGESIYDPEEVNIFSIRYSEGLNRQNHTFNPMFFEAVENADSLHWIWDKKGMVYLNRRCRESLPCALGKILVRPGLMLKNVRKEDRNTIRFALKEYFHTGKFDEVVGFKHEKNEDKYFRIIITPQPAIGNFPKRNHAVAYDITSERKLARNAEIAAQRAETANKNKTAFLANMSHEIRSPLNGIIGFSELLADTNLTEAERERYLYIIQNNGNALISLLSDLIDISKLESGKLLIAKRRFVPASLMEELKFQFENSANGKQEGVKIVFTGTSSFKDIEIDSDSNRLRQVLVNLITNAMKFTTKGRIEIGADYMGDDMLFWVKDSGIGIPYENHRAIFERFRQVDSPDLLPIAGFGLGLAISRALVELLGGHIWVESVPGVGSLFAFTIKTNTNTNTDNHRTMETNQFTGNSYPFNFKERTILIAEDIEFSFLYMEAVLRRTGVKILWAQNGREAIDHVNANQDIDLILMDMHMPVVSGYEATEIISKLRPWVPIIAQTAFVLPDDVKKCYASGCTGYLSKPIRKEQLLHTLSEYFNKMEQQSEDVPVYKSNIG